MMRKKRCYMCKKRLPIKVFHANRHQKDGLSSRCSRCNTKQHKQWSDRHRKHVREYHAQWVQDHITHVRKYFRKYQRNRWASMTKAQREKIRKINNERAKEKYRTDPEYRAARCQAKHYTRAQKDRINAKTRKRYATDPKYREARLQYNRAYNKEKA